MIRFTFCVKTISALLLFGELLSAQEGSDNFQAAVFLKVGQSKFFGDEFSTDGYKSAYGLEMQFGRSKKLRHEFFVSLVQLSTDTVRTSNNNNEEESVSIFFYGIKSSYCRNTDINLSVCGGGSLYGFQANTKESFRSYYGPMFNLALEQSIDENLALRVDAEWFRIIEKKDSKLISISNIDFMIGLGYFFDIK